MRKLRSKEGKALFLYKIKGELGCVASGLLETP